MAHKDWYVALVDAGEPFDPVEHRRRDLPVRRVSLTGSEDDEVDRLGLVCIRRTDAPTLDPGGARWVHLSRELADGSLKHMAYGYVIPTPKREDDEFETFEFNCSPVNWAALKVVAAQALKVLPFFEPVTVSLDSRNDVEEILDGYSSVPHCHRSTHQVTFAEITGAGSVVLDAPAPWMPGPQVSTVGTPLAGVLCDSTAEWTQSRDGDYDAGEMLENVFSQKKVSTLTPDELERSWLKPNTEVNGDSGWKVIESTIVRRYDLPVANYPVLMGPFNGPSNVYNYVQDQNLQHPIAKPMSFERAWYKISLKLAWTIRQKRIERISFALANGGQAWATGEVKVLSVRLEDVSRDDLSPYWTPGGNYVAGTLWKVGDTVWACMRTHKASFSFAQDIYVTGPQGGILQQWQQTVGDQSALGDRGAGSYWLTARGELTAQALMLKGRAMILHSQRCVEIKFKHLLTDELLDVTARNSVRLSAPPDMLRGSPNGDGVVVAKVYAYEIVSDQDDEYLECTLRACVGGGLFYDVAGTLVTQTGQPWDRMVYGSYAAQIAPDLPGLQAAASVTNDVPAQVAAIQAQDFAPDASPPRVDPQQSDPKNIIKTVPTSFNIYLTQISGRPDISHDIAIQMQAPFSGPRQWSVA